MFLDPDVRSRFADWAGVARSCVALMRRETVTKPDDPVLLALVDELTRASRDFGQWWNERDVERQDSGSKVILHPLVGPIELDWNIFRYTGSPEQQLALYNARPGSESDRRLAQLRNFHR